MATWQLQNAKAKFSEVIETAEKKGPQIITRRGVDAAVVLSMNEWRRVQEERSAHGQTREERSENLLKFLQSCPDFEVAPRGRMRLRKPVQF